MSGFRLSEADFAAIQKRKAATTSKEKLQALGRLSKGQQNNTEAKYDAHLAWKLSTGEILWYRFEAIKLIIAKNTSLTVDFAVMASDGVLEMHDVKGSKAIFSDDARVKMKVAAEMFPFRFAAIYPRKKAAGGGWEREDF